MKKNNLRQLIFNNYLLIFALFFIFIEPHKFTDFAIFHKVITYLKVLFSFIFLVLYFLRGKYKKIDIFILIYFITILISSIINKVELLEYLYFFPGLIGFLLYSSMAIDNNKQAYLKTFSLYFIIISICNFITVLLNNDRYNNRVYFLGYDNTFVPIIVIGCFILLICLSEKKYIKSLLYKMICTGIILLNFIESFIVRSATFKVGMVAVLFAYFLFYKNKKIESHLKKNTYFLYLIISFVFFLMIVVLRMQDHFEYIIVNMLHRNMTFTGRTYFWDLSIEYIKKNIFIGTGYWNMTKRLTYQGIYHAHSTYLSILLESGIVGFVSYYIILIKNGFNINKIKLNKIKKIITFAFFSYFIMTVYEVYIFPHLFYLLMLLADSYSFKEGKQNENIDS